MLKGRPSRNSLFPKVKALYQVGRLTNDMKTPSQPRGCIGEYKVGFLVKCM